MNRRGGCSGAPPRALRPDPTSPRKPGEALYEAVRYLLATYQSRDRERACYSDISISECHALEQVVGTGGCSVNDLASALRLDKSTASRIAASLVEKGYLKRSGRPDDRRAVKITPTATGRALEACIKREIVARQRRALEGFSSPLRDELPRALRALADSAARPSSPSDK